MPFARSGFTLQTWHRSRPDWRSAFSLGARARGSTSEPAVPEPGNFIVVAPAMHFSGDPADTWRPAAEGSWGTAHLQAPSAWGTVLSAERSKAGELMEGEDVHGRLYKGGIGDVRWRMEVRAVMRFPADVNPCDDCIIGGQTWHIHSVKEIWQDAEWGELAISLVRWPGLIRRGAFDKAAL